MVKAHTGSEKRMKAPTNTFVSLGEVERLMKKTIINFTSELQSLRTGTASASMLDSIRVEAYDTNVPLSQVATVSVIDARMLGVSVWDKSTVKAVDRAIRESNLGLNPIVDGLTLRIPLPAPSVERRHELVRVSKAFEENAKVAIRNVRKNVLNNIKRQVGAGTMQQHTMNSLSSKIQDLTDKYVGEVEQLRVMKEKEILTV